MDDSAVFEMIGPFETSESADRWVEDTGYGNDHAYRIEDVIEPFEPGPFIDVHAPTVSPVPGP